MITFSTVCELSYRKSTGGVIYDIWCWYSVSENETWFSTPTFRFKFYDSVSVHLYLIKMDAMEEPVCFSKVNDDDIAILDFDDPIWNNSENFFPLEYFHLIQKTISFQYQTLDRTERDLKQCRVHRTILTCQITSFPLSSMKSGAKLCIVFFV